MVGNRDTKYEYVCPNCEWRCHEDEATLAVKASRACPDCRQFLNLEPAEG